VGGREGRREGGREGGKEGGKGVQKCLLPMPHHKFSLPPLPPFPRSLAPSLPGVCAALTQKTLQGLSRNSYLYSAELAFYGQICLALLIAARYITDTGGEGECRSSFPPSLPPSLFRNVSDTPLPPSPPSYPLSDAPSFSLPEGVGPLTLLPVVMNAAGGIIVGLVTKYAGGE